jgi:serine/threonine protein kinase
VKIFSYSELRKATHDFSGANKIGEGGFGSVFRVNMSYILFTLSVSHAHSVKTNHLTFHFVNQGVLRDGTTVAVKVLSATSRQGVREFLTELTAISDIKHENLVTLIGCCAEGSHRILVYNYLENNSLAQTLLGNTLFF